ncbi:MAG: PAS domain S-box protein [Chroococcidiopsidaceae cyanobacterium CP_BM_ER_R8_30]|nr:PAS domain S-box protein [Chroococcidiopsidaceae cyanobacterium CP_BM_ER_R8_30]
MMSKVDNSSLRRYGIAVLSVTLVLLLKLLLEPLIGQESPFLLFLVAVMAATYYGGLGPGLLATVLATGISGYFFLGPTRSVLGGKSGQIIELSLFVLEGVLINLLIWALQAAKSRAELNALKAEKRRESQHQSEELFRMLVEGVEEYAIFMLDLDGNVVSWNTGAERILGYQEAEVLGRSFSSIYTPEDIQSGRPEYALRTAVATGRTQDDRWHVRKDGSWFWANGVVTPLRDTSGHLRGFSKILRDYTKTKQAQEALQKSEERLRLLIENVRDYAILMLDPDGCIASWTLGAERILGYQEAEILGQPFSCFFASEAIQQGVPEQELQQAVKDGRSEKECWHIRKNGTRFWANEVTTALYDETGLLRGFSKVMRDITERKRAEEERAQLLVREQAARAEAEAASRAKDEFLSIVSHELRTPLAAILLWAELLRDGGLDDDTIAQALEIIERNAKSQSQLIEDLLDISRIITGNLRLSVQLVDLVPVVKAAVDSLRLAAEAKDIQLQSVLNTALCQVLGDAQRLQQVVSNLLSNAIKFTPNGGRVELCLTRIDSEACITVSDTGRGISPEFLPYVFDRFRQANTTTTRTQAGLGLGLAIVRHLVELHSGSVYAASPGEGRGATFTVYLPLAAIPRQTSEQQRTNIQNRRGKLFDSLPNLGGIWVLVVDDEADMREVIAMVLKQVGADVTAVASASEVMEVLTAEPSHRKPDVLLCDIGMPGEDGYALLRQVRALPAEQGGQIPIAALTAYAREEERRQALLAGFQLHVPKPVNPSELITAVANLAGRISSDL